jgi:light-regulated signal transduction histidine kinase (bacteriophytochrome)
MTILEGSQTFHVFVPFVPNGEFQGVIYMRITPDFTNITNEIVSSYDEAAVIYTSVIMLGLLAMYYISSFSVKERDDTHKKLIEEQENHIKDRIIHEKESIFTQRIYHTHHKAEKVMGFIKEDIREISGDENKDLKERITKYSNFISRVIYDMKWYDPPIQTIRGQSFNTDLNELIRFIVDHIFLRLSTATEIYNFDLELDESLPKVPVNEFVAWEVLEPLIQNSIDHAKKEKVTVKIISVHDESKKLSTIIISDNGKGIDPDLLSEENGVKRIFLENTSTKVVENKNSGYGCYLANEIAVKRCGWKLDVKNNEDEGCSFILTIAV